LFDFSLKLFLTKLKQVVDCCLSFALSDIVLMFTFCFVFFQTKTNLQISKNQPKINLPGSGGSLPGPLKGPERELKAN